MTLLRRLKSPAGWALLALVVVGLLAVGVTRDQGPQTPEDRAASISRRIACPVCDGESVFESRNNASASIRTAIERRVAAGQLSDDEIIGFVEQRFSAQVLLVPRGSGLEALVWALPAAAVVIAAAALVVTFRRWRQESRLIDDPTDDDRRLVAAALDEESP
ncbi:MAG: cytochrome c-type biogenesis protein CcmH [Actinomycetota bacterium]|nr:cytochrome c-type biogenesis protein CcmH [Actinomycetota bacterium]